MPSGFCPDTLRLPSCCLAMRPLALTLTLASGVAPVVSISRDDTLTKLLIVTVTVALGLAMNADSLGEIGRASCRERVWNCV